MTWLAVQALYQTVLHAILWYIQRHIQNADKQGFLQIFTKSSIPGAWQGLEYASVVSFDRSATTYIVTYCFTQSV